MTAVQADFTQSVTSSASGVATSGFSRSLLTIIYLLLMFKISGTLDLKQVPALPSSVPPSVRPSGRPFLSPPPPAPTPSPGLPPHRTGAGAVTTQAAATSASAGRNSPVSKPPLSSLHHPCPLPQVVPFACLRRPGAPLPASRQRRGARSARPTRAGARRRPRPSPPPPRSGRPCCRSSRPGPGGLGG